MKCPKCGYLGFETSDRCRNCGYDFSLALDVGPAGDLPLNSRNGAGEPLSDFDLTGLDVRGGDGEATTPLDLDRVIGVESVSEPEPRRAPKAADGRKGRSTPAASGATPTPPGASSNGLPLFSITDDETPLITTPRPPRPPLAVRRPTPEVPRTRTRPVTPRPEEVELAFLRESGAGEESPPPAVAGDTIQRHAAPPPASATRRIAAALIDAALLAGINVAVLYLTLALAGLSGDQLAVLPPVPLAAFLALLNGGYVAVFTAASGQTIGKMLVAIRVTADDGRRVDIPRAVLRAVGCGVSLLTAGLGYLPAFVMADGRALHDRISRTRVVSAQ